MDALTVLNLALAVINILVAAFQGWKEWRTRRTPSAHPLETVLRDVAAAIRETTPPRS